MPSIYSLIQPGQTINSGSFLKNDKTKKNQTTLSDIRMASIRDFDTVPTPMSSAFMESGSEVRDGILSAYAQYGSAMKYDPALRSTVDLAMSLVMNQPYDKVTRNHDAYVRIFAGQDLDDKALGEAMVDAWNSDQVATDIATLQRRKDAAEDEDEIARLEEQIQAKERDAIRLGDYTDRAGIKGWFGNQLVKTMQIAPQVIEGATQSMLYSLAFAGLSALLTPAGATTVLGGSAGIAGASSMLNYLRTLASTAQGAGQLGSAAGTASYLAQTVLPREYGTMSRQLEQFLDSNDMHMDKETRRRASAVYALASTAIEFMTPEPGFGKMLMGVAPESLLQNSFKGWLKRVGVNMLEGAASESIEEALQDFVGSFIQDAAAISSNRKGTTHYNIESLADSMPKYFAQAEKTLIDTFVPSLLVGLPGSVTSANVASYLTDYRNMRDMAFRAVSSESRSNALHAQKVNARTTIVSSDIIDFGAGSSKAFASQIEASTQNEESAEPAKLDPVKVRFDRERGRYVPIDEYNENLAKYLYVDLKNDAIAVDIVNDGAVRMASDDIRNAAESAGGAVRNGSEIVFRNREDAYRFAQSINDSSVMYRDADGQLTLEYADTEGNPQIAPIEIDENADIAGIVDTDTQRRASAEAQQADPVQDTGSQTSVQEMADAIRTASRKHISENASMALARLFDMLPENVRNTIFSRNNGRLVITDSEYERITGRKLNPNSRAAAWLNRLQMVFTGRSDASSFVHEMGHIALIANPELAEGVRLAFAVNLDTEEGLSTFLDFIDENKDIIRVGSREAAINLLREIGNIDGGNVFTENAEELLMSMLEAHFRTDLKGENLTVLPQQVRDIFQRIANSIRRIYGRATGRTTLPRDVQDAFNSFFWNGDSTVADTANASSVEAEAEPMTNSEVIRNNGQFNASNPDIYHQGSLGENAVEQGQRRFMRMDDERFKRSIEKDIFLPEYVVKAKLSSEDQSVVDAAKMELDDRDKFSLLSPAEISALYDTDSADEYVSRMESEGSLSLADESQTERVYRKAWAYAHTMTPKEAVNSFKQRFNTLPRLLELKRILGPRKIQARTAEGQTYTRMYVPQNNPVYQKLSRLSSDSPISEVNEVLSSMDSNPRAWLHAYQDAVNSGARISGALSEDQDIIDSYVDMADADFDIIKNELRRGEEPYGVSYDTVYGVSDADIVNLSVEEAERRSREAGNTAEDENAGSGANPSERAKDLQKSLKIASTAASRAQDRVRTLEGQMDSLRQRHKASEKRMHENLQVLRKVARSKAKEAESLKTKLSNALTRENDTRHEYAERLKRAEKELRTANNEIKRAEKRLEDSRASFERRMNDMRDKVSSARQEAHAQEVRANKLDRLLKSMATRAQSDRITRAIRGRLSINSKTHDAAMLEEPLYYIYYLMHNGQNRRYSQYQSTEKMPDFDYGMEVLRDGLSKGLEEMGEDGSLNSVIIDLGHTDKDGNPVIAYSGNLGAYRYSRQDIPERLRSRLSADTIAALESDGPLRWSGLTVAQKRDIYDALVTLKQEAATSRAEINDALMFSRRSLAREAARAVMDPVVPEITDEIRESVKQYMQSHDHSYDGTPTDEDVWDHIARHPDLIMNEVKPGKVRKAVDSYRMSFIKIQRLARILDGGKADGPFQRIFVRSFQEAYDKVLSNTDRRMGRFYEALEGLIGKRGSEEYRKRIEALSKDTIHFRTNALAGGGIDAKLSEVMAMYIYSQNINGVTKLVSDAGNNLSLEDMARINPEKMSEYLDLEIQMRADKGRDDGHPTPFNTFREEDIVNLRNRLSKGEFGESVVPEWVRGIGDMMIDQLALETPRIAQAAYADYNVMLQIQDRYFPLMQASRGSWGDIIFGTGKKRGVASVDSGSLKIRQKNARYPLMLDPFSVFFSAIREQENLINMSKPVSDASYLMKFGGIGDVVRNRFGEKWTRALNDYLQRIANPENRLTDVEKTMNRFLGNAAAAKIGLNLMTGVKQFVSVIPAAVDGELSPADIVRGISHVLSPSLRGELRDQMDRVAYSVVRSGYDPDISRLRRMEDFSRLGQLNQRFVDISTWLTQRGDEISKMLIWSAKYDKEIRAGKSEADAAYAATDLVNRTMSVTSPIAMSEAQTNRNPLWRAFMMFTNDLFQMWNIMFADIPMDFRNKEYGRAFSRFGGVALTAAALSLLAGGWLPDDDDDEKFDSSAFLDDFFQNLLGYTIPLFGQQVQDWSRGYTQSLITAPGEVFSMGRMVWKGLWNEEEYTADQYLDQLLDALLAGGELIGVPATGIKRPAQSIYDFDTGEWRLNPAYLFGVRWGDGTPNLIRLLSD